MSFDISELTAYEKNLIKLANDKMPKESKKFLRQEGTKLRKKTLSEAKGTVKKKTGNYFKGIKRGKVYKWSGNGAYAIRVYGANHAHLIENGHRIVRNGKEVGFSPGKHVFQKAEKSFSEEYFKDTENFIDDVLKKGL